MYKRTSYTLAHSSCCNLGITGTANMALASCAARMCSWGRSTGTLGRLSANPAAASASSYRSGHRSSRRHAAVTARAGESSRNRQCQRLRRLLRPRCRALQRSNGNMGRNILIILLAWTQAHFLETAQLRSVVATDTTFGLPPRTRRNTFVGSTTYSLAGEVDLKMTLDIAASAPSL